ncbi:hypothetical protein RQP46_008243 [Phenoliferia psychrophenolica]
MNDTKQCEKADLGDSVMRSGQAHDREVSLEASENTYSPEDDGKLLRRVDLILMPLMCISYGIQFADKASLSYSALFGLLTDNNLKGADFSLLTTIFYVGYLIAEWPTCWLMQRYNTGAVLGVLFITWGGLVMCIAACNGFASLMVVRFLLALLGHVVVFLFLGSPDQARWLTAAQKAHVWECFRDPQVYFIAAITFVTSMPNGGLVTFQSLIFKGLGFTSLETILFSMPISAFSHRWEKYATMYMFPITAVSLFLAWSLIPSNIVGRTKKSAVSAVVFICYCAGNAGLIMSISCFGINFLLALGWRLYYVRVNAERDRQSVDVDIQAAEVELETPDRTDLQDKSFRCEQNEL